MAALPNTDLLHIYIIAQKTEWKVPIVVRVLSGHRGLQAHRAFAAALFITLELPTLF